MKTIRPFRTGDESAFLDLHRRAFGTFWTRDTWEWRFLHTPLARTDLLGAFDDDGRCVASYGGVALDFVLEGQRTLAVQQSDVAVDPDLRKGLGGSRVLVELTRAYFDHCGRNSEMIWGFPEPGLRRIVVHHARVDLLRDVLFLVRPVAGKGSPPTDGDLECARLDALTPQIDRLWARCEPELPVTTARHARYLDWRFLRHPSIDYELHAVRDRDGIRGCMAIRDGGWHRDTLSIMEWIIPRDDLDAEHALLAYAQRLAEARQKSHLVAWFPAPELRFHRFQVAHGFFAQHVPYQQGVRCWRNGITRHWLHENWFQTMSDIDFF